MWTLLLQGALADEITELADVVRQSRPAGVPTRPGGERPLRAKNVESPLSGRVPFAHYCVFPLDFSACSLFEGAGQSGVAAKQKIGSPQHRVLSGSAAGCAGGVPGGATAQFHRVPECYFTLCVVA